MADMDDDDMTAEEFDALLGHGEPVELNVNLRPRLGQFFGCSVQLATQPGFSSVRVHEATVTSVAATTHAPV